MAITRTFKNNCDRYGYGYFGYIEDGQLVLGESWPREGGITYRGSFTEAKAHLEAIKEKAPRLYNSVMKYYTEKQIEENLQYLHDELHDKKSNTSSTTAEVLLYKVQLYMDGGHVLLCQVSGQTENDILKKLTPDIPEMLLVQGFNKKTLAINSSKISAIQFLED